MAEVLHPLPPTDQYHQTGMSQNPPPSGRNAQRSGYRGTATPVHAFKSTPTTLRSETRSIATSPPPQPLASDNASAANRQRYPAQASVSTTSSSSSSNPPSLPPLTKDDTALFSNFQVPPFSQDSDGIVNENEPPEAFPERYRRGHKRVETAPTVQSPPPQKPTGLEGVTASGVFGSGKLGQFQYNPQQFATVSPPPRTESGPTVPPQDTKPFPPPTVEKTDLPKRYRKRVGSSGSTIEAGARTPSGSGSLVMPQQQVSQPAFFNTTQDSPQASAGTPQRQTYAAAATRQETAPRSPASADAVRRINNPSPLSRPMTGNDASNASGPRLSSPYSPNPTISQSPAVAAMAALKVNDKQDPKSTKSRLRRAFSFGSSAELKRATEQDAALERARARQERFSSELDDEADEVARKQEAAGLGNSIYSGQGGVFAGSTDNLSIQSTASSASLMLRKMGKGMKKGGRSIKGLFRPKSVIGVPAADGPSMASVGQVSMVTVEAERENVNVNADPHDQVGGGTGFPKLERNSVDVASRAANAERPNTSGDSRRSVVGSEHERQEVLAAVKRGILKRSAGGNGSPIGSPSTRPVDGPQEVYSPSHPSLDRKGSPVPSTASSEPRRTGHRRNDAHTLEGDDYFNSVPRITGNNQSTRSLPDTPGRGVNRNISFSPRIQFHDAWSSSEYDRRGDIATCNRLTPMLAQQIKEELNTFKMEMEVHEASKPHTHFF